MCALTCSGHNDSMSLENTINSTIMNRFKSLYTVVLIFMLVVTAVVCWKYVTLHREVRDLRNQVNSDSQFVPRSIIDQNNKTDPPNGEADTSNWFVAKDTHGRFTLLYPQNWTTEPSGNYVVIPERFSGEKSYLNNALLPLSLMVSTSTNTQSWWRKITLANGEQVYYSFEDGFDHYHMVSGDEELTLSIPARSYNGLYTDQELKEATQIINTYRLLK